MHTALCETLGIEHPIIGFTPSEHVAAAISKAGGLGVLGCVRFNDAGELDHVLDWMDEHTEGRPYGVDVVMPAKVPTEGTQVDLDKLIPEEHKAFVERTLRELGVPELPAEAEQRAGVLGWLHSVARSHVEVALRHPIKLIANALGSPPVDVIEQAHAHGVPVAALAGKAEHARRHVDNGVDFVVAQGYEAGRPHWRDRLDGAAAGDRGGGGRARARRRMESGRDGRWPRRSRSARPGCGRVRCGSPPRSTCRRCRTPSRCRPRWCARRRRTPSARASTPANPRGC